MTITFLHSLIPGLQMSVVPHVTVLDIFARAGGGGSGSGGGGGDAAGLIALVGYVPTHAVASWFNRRVSQKAGYIFGTITAVIITGLGVTLSLWASSGAAFMMTVLVAIGAAVGLHSGTHNWWSRIRKRIQKNRKLLLYAEQKDGAWQETSLKSRVETVFLQFQEDWTTFNLARIKTYTTPHYFGHISLILRALDEMGRQNVVNQPALLQSAVVDVLDKANNDDDRFTAYIEGQAYDVLGEVKTQRVLSSDNSKFEELWTFDRQGNDWLLDGIDQATADQYQMRPGLKKFAKENDMYYSLDWGRLLLPVEGQLFSRGSFKASDVNNHVIGEWQGLLVQLYTYMPQKNDDRLGNYLIGQISLPKNYGGILVRRRDTERWPRIAPKGYIKIQTEWPDFNRRYSLYATDSEKVTSFELLNPAFMAWLYDSGLEVNIEVVGSIVYLYALTTASDNRYDTMLEVLRRAFKELER